MYNIMEYVSFMSNAINVARAAPKEWPVSSTFLVEYLSCMKMRVSNISDFTFTMRINVNACDITVFGGNLSDVFPN